MSGIFGVLMAKFGNYNTILWIFNFVLDMQMANLHLFTVRVRLGA